LSLAPLKQVLKPAKYHFLVVRAAISDYGSPQQQTVTMEYRPAQPEIRLPAPLIWR
jgi:hypothetical protein